MRTLLFLLFLACLVPLLFCVDLVRWTISNYRPAPVSVRRRSLPAWRWEEDSRRQSQEPDAGHEIEMRYERHFTRTTP